MNWLAWDTSTEQASVALWVDGVMHTAIEPQLRQHAKLLLPMIDDLLLSAGVSCQDLNGIVFGCGPGSFTGLRIACSVAQGLAYATDKPLYPVNSLQTIAAEVFHQGFNSSLSSSPEVLVMLDARMHEVYWAHHVNAEMPSISHVSSASEIEIGVSDAPLILAGVGLDTYAPQLKENIRSRVIEQRILFPKAEVMIRLAALGIIPAVSVEKAVPTYVRHQVTQGASHG